MIENLPRGQTVPVEQQQIAAESLAKPDTPIVGLGPATFVKGRIERGREDG